MNLTSGFRPSKRPHLALGWSSTYGEYIAAPAAMLIFTVFALSTALMFHPFLSNWLSGIAEPFHQLCMAAAPVGQHTELYQALVCGASLGDLHLKQDFAQTGLLHVIVVSGSHLVFLERILTRLLPLSSASESKSVMKAVAIFLGLSAFVLAADAQPPVLRAFFQMSLYLLNNWLRLNWRTSQTTLISGSLALAFCNDEATVRSLALSWTASLALNSFASTTLRDDSYWARMKNALLVQLRMYLLLAPALLFFSLPHPASILCNFLLAPVLGEWLFPASLVAFFWSKFAWITDFFWQASVTILKYTAQLTPNGWRFYLHSTPLLIAYLLLLSGAAITIDLRSKFSN
jgi:ComEC/Rec2-related protein